MRAVAAAGTVVVKCEGVAKGVGKEGRTGQPTPKGQATQAHKACLGMRRIREVDESVAPVQVRRRAKGETYKIERSLKPRVNQKANNVA